MSEKTPLSLLLPLRLYIGGFMLVQGFRKLAGNFLAEGGLTKFLDATAPSVFIPGYGSFLKSVVYPHEG